MKEPLVSIGMATFGHHLYIEQAIASILAQDYSNWELVISPVVHDVATLSVLARYNDPRISLRLANYGSLWHQRNLTAFAARGDYFMWFDSDDVLHPGVLRELVNFCETKNLALAYPDFHVGDKNLAITDYTKVDEFNFEVLKNRCYITDLSFSKRSALLKHLPINNRHKRNALWDVWLRFCSDSEMSGQIAHFPKPVFIYRQHGANDHTTASWDMPIVRIGPLPRDIPEITVAQLETSSYSTVLVTDPRMFLQFPDAFKRTRTVIIWDTPYFTWLEDIKNYPWVQNIPAGNEVADVLKARGIHFYLVEPTKLPEFLINDAYEIPK